MLRNNEDNYVNNYVLWDLKRTMTSFTAIMAWKIYIICNILFNKKHLYPFLLYKHTYKNGRDTQNFIQTHTHIRLAIQLSQRTTGNFLLMILANKIKGKNMHGTLSDFRQLSFCGPCEPCIEFDKIITYTENLRFCCIFFVGFYSFGKKPRRCLVFSQL